MRPPICAVCFLEWDCDLVWFARSQKQEEFEKRMKEIGGTGHPPDAEWFCKEHAKVAVKHKGLLLSKAWPKIKAEIAATGSDGQMPERPASHAARDGGRTLNVRIKGELFGADGELFLYVDSDLRNEHELKVGDRIECILTAIERRPEPTYCSCEGEIVGEDSDKRSPQSKHRPIAEPGSPRQAEGACAALPSERAWWDVVNYWNELHVPGTLEHRYGLKTGDRVECEWKSIARS